VPLKPQSIYGITKLSQEYLCLNVSTAYEIPIIVLRFFNVYGPGQSLVNSYTGILSAFYSRIVQGDPIEVFEDGLESRDFVYIDDVVDAILCALTTRNTGLLHRIFNVGSGIPVCLNDLARIVIEASGKSVSFYHSGAYRVGDIRHAFADTTHAEQDLNFKARKSLEAGIGEWMAWAKDCNQHGHLEIAEHELLQHKLYRRVEA
jgi:dTDP-L-rhamnose 4-epimerase